MASRFLGQCRLAAAGEYRGRTRHGAAGDGESTDGVRGHAPTPHNYLKNDAHDLKNYLERRVSRFCTICDKNQPLNKTNEKVMAILVPRLA